MGIGYDNNKNNNSNNNKYYNNNKMACVTLVHTHDGTKSVHLMSFPSIYLQTEETKQKLNKQTNKNKKRNNNIETTNEQTKTNKKQNKNTYTLIRKIMAG